MSLLVTGLVWKHADVGQTALLVLLAMADIADDKGEEIWPAMETLAAKARCDVRTVRRVLRYLESEEGGAFIAQVEAASGRPGRFNAWRINLEKVILSCPAGLYGVNRDRKGNKEGGQIVRPELSTGHGARSGGTFDAGRADIHARHIDNNPGTVLETSCPRDGAAPEGGAAARVKWEAVQRALHPTKFLKYFGGTGTWAAPEPLAIDGGSLVVALDSSFLLSRVAEVQGDAEKLAGMPIRFVLTARAEAKMPRRQA